MFGGANSHTRSQLTAAILAAIVFAAPALGAAETLRLVEAPSIEVDSLEELPALLESLDLGASGGATIDSREIEYFQLDLLGRSWASTPVPRALVIGQPAFCQGSANRSLSEHQGSETGRDLAEEAFKTCLGNVSRIETAFGVDCKCRLVAIDDALVVEPGLLQFSNRTPTFALVLENGSSSLSGSIMVISGTPVSPFATAVPPFLSGESDLALLEKSGTAVCRGHRKAADVTETKTEGTMELRCEQDLGTMRGTYQFVHDGGQKWGLFVQLKSDRAKMILAAGMDKDGFDALLPGLVQWFGE